MVRRQSSRGWVRWVLGLGVLGLIVAVVVYPLVRERAPEKSPPIGARLELAAGEVEVDQDGPGDASAERAVSGTALRVGAAVTTGDGARALVRLPDGSGCFLRGSSAVRLDAEAVFLDRGEYWLDVPEIERDAIVHRVGAIGVSAVAAALSIQRTDAGAVVYVARGMAIVTAPGGRVEIRAGEQAIVRGEEPPTVAAVAFWDDWTGGMADHDASTLTFGAGSGTIYGVDSGAEPGSPAQPLQIKRQSVRAVVREGLSETEVDQVFFNPSPRPVEGWYWFVLPEGASVTGFALETDGVLVEGEIIEKREAAAKYVAAKGRGHAPAILEWVDGRSYRARIFPVPASGSRRVVLRYLELRPVENDKLSYLYPMGRGAPVRIGELSLSVDLGEAGRSMKIATLDEARIENGGERVTMRRSGYTPRADFQLEARFSAERAPLTVARFETGADAADYVMARYTPEVDWSKVPEPRAEVVVVVDTSAAGDESSRQLKVATAEAILRALAQKRDRFALVSLDVRPTVLFPPRDLAEAGDEPIAKALEALADHASGGATDLAAMFEAALSRLHGADQPAVIYVGDGIATSGERTGEQLIERLRRALRSSRARLFTVAVGSGADEALLGELARAGGGESYRVDVPSSATARALELVAAVKVPTITDFELDLGAGLDEPLVNVSGKVPRGRDVVLLARTHHDLPKHATVRGRLAGESFDKEVAITAETSVVTAFVPRLWAGEQMRRLLGAAAGPEAERGRIVALGLEYGLVTPFTSILALESESAFSDMGILRRRSPLRGVRLGALDPAPERQLAAPGASPALAFGCSKSEFGGEAPEPAPVTAQAPPEQTLLEQRQLAAKAEREEEEADGEGEPAPAPPAAMAPSEPQKGGMGRLEKAEPEQAERLDGDDKTKPGDGQPPHRRDASDQWGPDRRGLEPPALGTCSDIARRPLAERMLLWSKRLSTAAAEPDLLERYRAAQRGCELGDWQAERAFLRLLQARVHSEAGARLVLEHFGDRPEVQAFVARLILRRVVDERVVAAVETVLFGKGVDWAQVDRDLSAIEDGAERLQELRRVMARAPDDPNGQIRLVELLADLGRSSEALSAGRRLRDQGLSTLAIQLKLGDVLAREKLEAEAVRTYSEIVEFDPTSMSSRMLLGDIYLGHGWYDAAYRQFLAVTEAAPDEGLGWLRLAAAAAGGGRIDEALRLERKVASAQGRPGPEDPRRWARLLSAARLARLIAEPPKERAPSRESLERKLKELGLLNTGEAVLVIVTWEDLRSDIVAVTRLEERTTALGEAIDAAPIGLSAILLSPGDRARSELTARLRSLPRRDPIRLYVHELAFDGKALSVAVRKREIAAGQTGVAL